jgi:PmbA protein
MTPDRSRIENALEVALTNGAADAEIVFTRDASLELSVAKSKVETLSLSESIGMGVRVLMRDRRMGSAYTTSMERLPDTIKAACENASVTEQDECNVLPDEVVVSEDNWAEDDFEAIPVREKVEFCRALEAETLGVDARISHVDEARYSDSRWEYVIANSRGLYRRFQNALCDCSVSAAAVQEGSDPETGWEFDSSRSFAGLRREWVARNGAERAVRGLGGVPCGTGSRPVILENFVASQFLGVLGPALMAHNVLKGKSMFARSVGEVIASECFAVKDCNDLSEGLNRGPFDAEGVSARETFLIENGRLQGFLHNSYTAGKMGDDTTANAARAGGFRGVPEVGATNCYIVPGTRSLDGLISDACAGFLVTSALGVHTANPISGDFSFGVDGFEIENGRLGRSVRGVTIAGNLKNLLMNVAAVGEDLRFFGVYGAPSVLVSSMMISGT